MRGSWIVAAAGVLAAGSSALADFGNVLVWGTGVGQNGADAVKAYLDASAQFASVTAIAQDATIPFNQLNQYDRVLYFSDGSAGQDPDGIGDQLDLFAGTGKRLVIATFSWADQGNNTLGGDIIQNGTSPFLVNGGSLYTNVNMQSNDGSPFWNGVNALQGFFHDNVSLSAGAVLRGSWDDGSHLLATKGNVVGVNLYPNPLPGSLGGDYEALFTNALIAVPAPASMGLLALAGVCAARRRR